MNPKKAVIYARVSTYEQNADMQLNELRELATRRGLTIVKEYVDHISGSRARRPGLDAMLLDAGRREFDVLLVWAADRLARSVRHFLEVLDELQRLQIEFVSLRENIDTGGPLGRAVMVIVGAVAELERNLIIERVKSGMRRAKLEGRHIGRKPLDVDRASIFRHHIHGQSLKDISRTFHISRTSVARIIRAEKKALPKGGVQMRLEELENTASQNAA